MRNPIIALIITLFTLIIISQSCKKEETGDGIPPVIVIQGSNPMFWALDFPYIDPGAIAYDVTMDGDTIDITNSIVVVNSVDVTLEGDYTVKYNVKDESGLSAEEKVRNVKVVPGK